MQFSATSMPIEDIKFLEFHSRTGCFNKFHKDNLIKFVTEFSLTCDPFYSG